MGGQVDVSISWYYSRLLLPHLEKDSIRAVLDKSRISVCGTAMLAVSYRIVPHSNFDPSNSPIDTQTE